MCETIEFSLSVFTGFAEFSDKVTKIIVITVKGLELATTASARHM